MIIAIVSATITLTITIRANRTRARARDRVRAISTPIGARASAARLFPRRRALGHHFVVDLRHPVGRERFAAT